MRKWTMAIAVLLAIINVSASPAKQGHAVSFESRSTSDTTPSPREHLERTDMSKPPLVFTFYIAAPMEKVWDGFVGKEPNRAIFVGADFDVDLKPGGAMTWSGPNKEGKRVAYVTGKIVRVEAPRLLEYRFGLGDGAVMSHVKVELTQETEAVKVVVTNDEFPDNNPNYAQNADGWPRILSRLKTLLETGKTFRPH